MSGLCGRGWIRFGLGPRRCCTRACGTGRDGERKFGSLRDGAGRDELYFYAVLGQEMPVVEDLRERYIAVERRWSICIIRFRCQLRLYLLPAGGLPNTATTV